MDRGKTALLQKRRKVEVDVKGIKKAVGQVPTNVHKGVSDGIFLFVVFAHIGVRKANLFSHFRSLSHCMVKTKETT